MKFTLHSVVVVGLFYSSAVPALHAAIRLPHSPVQPIVESGKPKLVKFKIENDLTVSIDLKLGETPTTLQPGQTLGVRLSVGTQVTVATALNGHPAGEVIAQVETSMDDVVVRIHA